MDDDTADLVAEEKAEVADLAADSLDGKVEFPLDAALLETSAAFDLACLFRALCDASLPEPNTDLA